MFTHAAIKAGPICANLIWCYIRNFQQNLQAPRTAEQHYLDIYAALFSHVPQINSFISPRVVVPPVPHAPDPAALALWANVYWGLSLVSGLFAIAFAVLVKKSIRNHKDVLRRHGQLHMRKSLERDVKAWFISQGTDEVYRLFQIFLVGFILGYTNSFLGHINSYLGITVIVPLIFFSIFYS
ncbi:hypothetical protein BJY52DRAFT_1373044 [Lactarius psammicola]|nr:hypothetical protein BJY52DRAFT_1373044 [Lactarius psammicola]